MTQSTAETLYDFIGEESGNAKPTGDTSNQVSKHREFKLSATDGEQQLFLTFKDTETGIYHIPLGVLDSHEKTDSNNHENVIVPVVPVTYTTMIAHQENAIVPRENGYIYIFKGDYLWRELKVLSRGRYGDVNLQKYQGKDKRIAASGDIDTRILMPYKIAGDSEKLTMCYSEIQWSWLRINSMGGMDPIDFRLDKKNPPLLAEACGFDKETASKNRKERTQEIDLSGYDDNFPTLADDGTIARLENSSDVSADDYLLQQHKKSFIPVVYLHDPLGVAENLKQEHIRSAKDTELIAAYMAAEDYSLAKLLKIILDSEDGAVRVGVGKKFKDTHPYVKAQYNGAYQKLNEYEKERAQKSFLRDIEEAVKDAADIAKVTDVAKVNETLKFWDDLNDKSLKKMTEAGEQVVVCIDQVSAGIKFETAMMDYLESDNPVYISIGIARLVYFLEYFTFKSGLEYIKKITDKGNKIGIQIQLPAVINKARPVIIKLENGDLNSLNIKDTGFKLDTPTINGLTTKATNAYSKLLEALSKTKILDEGGLEWLVKLTKGYLGSNFNIAIEEHFVNKIYVTKKTYPKNVFRHSPKIEKSLNIKTKHIAFNGELPSQTFTRLSESASHKSAFFMVQGVLTTINAACAINTLSKAKVATAKDKMAVAAAINDVISFGVSLVDGYASLASKYYEKAQSVQQQKISNLSVKAEATKITRANKKGGLNTKKTNIEKILQKKYQKSYKVQLKINFQVAKYSQWTRIASHASSYLGVIGSVLGMGLSLNELMGQKTMRGKIAASVLLASSTLSFVMSLKAIRFIKTVSALSKVTKAGMLVGAATAESGVGLIIFGVSLVVDIVGGAYLNEVNRSWLIKAIDYCYFGQHPYGDWKLLDDNMHKRTVTGATPSFFGFTYQYKYDFPAECAEIYRRLFGYEGKVILGKVDNGSKNEATKYVVKGKIDLTQFIVGKSYFDLNMKIEYYESAGKQGDLFLFKHLKVRKVKSKEGILVGIEVFHEISLHDLSNIKKISMTTSLDIEGDGKRILPKQIAAKNDKGIDEQERVEFSLNCLSSSPTPDISWRIHNVGWRAKGGVKYDGNYQVGLKKITKSEYDLAKDYVETA